MRKFFSLQKMLLLSCISMSYLINFSILSRSVPVFHVSLFNISQLFLPYHVLFMWFFLIIRKGLKYLKEFAVLLIKQKDG